MLLARPSQAAKPSSFFAIVFYDTKREISAQLCGCVHSFIAWLFSLFFFVIVFFAQLFGSLPKIPGHVYIYNIPTIRMTGLAVMSITFALLGLKLFALTFERENVIFLFCWD